MAQTLHLKVVGKFPASPRKFFVAKALMFLWCIVTDLSAIYLSIYLVSSSPYDDDLSLYVILKARSWIRFILLLSPLIWSIHIRGEYPNCDSINDFMVILFLLKFMKGAIWASALSFLHKLWTWLSNFNSWSIVIPRRIWNWFFFAIWLPKRLEIV